MCLGDAKTAAADSTPPVLHEDEGSGVSGDEEQKVKADDDEENDNLSWIKSSGGCDLVPYFV
jgi:hypothetical protein